MPTHLRWSFGRFSTRNGGAALASTDGGAAAAAAGRTAARGSLLRGGSVRYQRLRAATRRGG